MDPALFTDNRTPTQFELNYIADPLKVGVYDISYKVFLVSYPSVQVQLSSVRSAFRVTIVDPCLPPYLAVTGTPLTAQTYLITSAPLVYQAPAFSVQETWCAVSYAHSLSDLSLAAALSFDASSRTFTVSYNAGVDLSGPTSRVYSVTLTATSNVVSAS